MTETTTNAATQDEASLTTQPPVDEQPAEAVSTADSEPQQTPTQQDEEESPQGPTNEADNPGEDDFDYQSWLEKKGIDPSTEEGKAQVAKAWREMEKKMHQTTVKASEVEKQIQQQPATNDDERVQRLEMLYNVNTWKQQKNITPEQDQAMGTYLTSNPDKLALVKHGLLTFDDVLNMSGAAQVDTESLKKQGKEEALRSLANKQRTTAPQGGATSTTAPAKGDPIMEALLKDD